MSNELVHLRLCAIRHIGDILLAVWEGIDGQYPLETIKKFESITDATRAKEDLQDFIKVRGSLCM